MNIQKNDELLRAQIRLTEAKAALAELKYDQESGKLVSQKEADRERAEEIANVKAKLLGLPVKVAPRCAGLSAREIEGILRTEIYAVLKEFAESESD